MGGKSLCQTRTDFSQGSTELIFLFFKGENYPAPIDVPVSRDDSGQPESKHALGGGDSRTTEVPLPGPDPVSKT